MNVLGIYVHEYIHIGMKVSVFIKCYTFTKSDFK